eukprot:TRINITY_DN2041_c0_g2_i2.p1 TRINITY_DN2041_c0_g2~~TRINITY_DN2041_c0_g2_i2.p1  ORF type:complete len:507 (+),score=169.77 TRINITY_DN2041_c0_g2_i2:102-1622(+)
MDRKQKKQKKTEIEEPSDSRKHDLLERVVTDPKFMLPGKSVRKVKVDERFKKMFHSKKFRDAAQRGASRENRELAELYYAKDEDKSQQESEESEESAKSSSSDYEDEIKSEEDLWENEEVPLEDKVSKRLAVVNLDWDQINAEDLMTIFSSLSKAKNGVEKVEIYISNYGKEQIKKDSLYGPQEIWKDSSSADVNKKEDDSEKEGKEVKEQLESDDGNDDPTKEVTSKPISKTTKKNEDTNEDFNQLALRKYELQKLRYYFAVVYCSSAKTAQQIYDEYDGFEYENSSLKFDLRFIPDDMKFFDPPKETCSEARPNHELKTQLVNSAIQSSNVKLTWEAPNTKRYEFISKNLAPEKLEEMDLKDYIGSESEEEDVDKFRKLLSYEPSEGRKGKAKGIEVTFKTGLDDNPESVSESDNETNRKKVMKQKKGKKKPKMHESTKEEQELELLIDKKRPAEDFKTDLEDPRFSSMFKDPRFVIDPSSKYYKNASQNFKSCLLYTSPSPRD